MEPPFKECKEYIGSSKGLDGKYSPNYIVKPCYEPNYLKAICYKLDSIEKELKKRD